MVAIFRQRCFARIQHFVQIEKRVKKTFFEKMSRNQVASGFKARRRKMFQRRFAAPSAGRWDATRTRPTSLPKVRASPKKWFCFESGKTMRQSVFGECVCVWERERVCVCAFSGLLSEGEKCESACLSKSPISSLWLWRQLRTPSVRSRTFQSCSVKKKSKKTRIKINNLVSLFLQKSGKTLQSKFLTLSEPLRLFSIM